MQVASSFSVGLHLVTEKLHKTKMVGSEVEMLRWHANLISKAPRAYALRGAPSTEKVQAAVQDDIGVELDDDESVAGADAAGARTRTRVSARVPRPVAKKSPRRVSKANTSGWSKRFCDGCEGQITEATMWTCTRCGHNGDEPYDLV